MAIEFSERQRTTIAAAITILSAVVILVAIGTLFWLIGAFFVKFSAVFLPLAVAMVAGMEMKDAVKVANLAAGLGVVVVEATERSLSSASDAGVTWPVASSAGSTSGDRSTISVMRSSIERNSRVACLIFASTPALLTRATPNSTSPVNMANAWRNGRYASTTPE